MKEMRNPTVIAFSPDPRNQKHLLLHLHHQTHILRLNLPAAIRTPLLHKTAETPMQQRRKQLRQIHMPSRPNRNWVGMGHKRSAEHLRLLLSHLRTTRLVMVEVVGDLADIITRGNLALHGVTAVIDSAIPEVKPAQ